MKFNAPGEVRFQYRNRFNIVMSDRGYSDATTGKRSNLAFTAAEAGEKFSVAPRRSGVRLATTRPSSPATMSPLRRVGTFRPSILAKPN